MVGDWSEILFVSDTGGPRSALASLSGAFTLLRLFNRSRVVEVRTRSGVVQKRASTRRSILAEEVYPLCFGILNLTSMVRVE